MSYLVPILAASAIITTLSIMYLTFSISKYLSRPHMNVKHFAIDRDPDVKKKEKPPTVHWNPERVRESIQKRNATKSAFDPREFDEIPVDKKT